MSSFGQDSGADESLTPTRKPLGPYRYMILILVGLDIPVMIYGLILIFKAAGKVGFSRLIGDNYGNPTLWVSGFCVAGHAILLVGAVAVLLDTDWWDETIKIGAGLVFVFQVLALGVAIAFYVGNIFKHGQGRVIDEETGDSILLTGKVIKSLTINTFLSPRMFATIWLSVAQMILLMFAVEKDKESQ